MNIRDASVVFIEDNHSNLLLFEDLLMNRIKVKSYCSYISGEMFFRWLDSDQGETPDIIFLDIQIPREDGYMVLECIRARQDLVNTVVIAVTANVLQPNLLKARKAGFAGLIGKPIRISQFESQANRILSGEQIWEI